MQRSLPPPRVNHQLVNFDLSTFSQLLNMNFIGKNYQLPHSSYSTGFFFKYETNSIRTIYSSVRPIVMQFNLIVRIVHRSLPVASI